MHTSPFLSIRSVILLLHNHILYSPSYRRDSKLIFRLFLHSASVFGRNRSLAIRILMSFPIFLKLTNIYRMLSNSAQMGMRLLFQRQCPLWKKHKIRRFLEVASEGHKCTRPDKRLVPSNNQMFFLPLSLCHSLSTPSLSTSLFPSESFLHIQTTLYRTPLKHEWTDALGTVGR